jgi:hypothetical protein
MPGNKIGRRIRGAFHATSYQSLAILFCFLLGLAMIANTQLGGEAMWFWYAILFRDGAKLYADLHMALQPLFVLEMDLWMKLFGIKCLVTETPSVLHLLILCFGIFLLLRESDWPDWQKAILLASTFVLWVEGDSYRFDDYHVTTESFILYSLILLLWLAKADSSRRQLVLAAALGILCGFTITSRINDGAALLAATVLSMLVLARKRKLLVSSLFIATSVLIWILVVKSTGDSLSDYLSNSLFRAAGSKGGTGSIFADPFLLFRNAVQMRHGMKWVFLWMLVVVVMGAVVQRYWKNRVVYITAVQLGIAGVVFALLRHHLHREQLLQYAIPFMVIVTYLLAPIVMARYSMWKLGHGERDWDAREILLLLPLAGWASISTSAAANPLAGYYAQVGMLLLLVPVVQPFRRQVGWANGSFLTVLVLIGVTGTIAKIHEPYTWDNLHSRPMFVDRQWYKHPVYGPMYIDQGLLQFSKSVCAEIGQGSSKPELLSLPFSYANYFCDTPPWHGYVHSFFDTTTRATVDNMMKELQIDPPQWIVYQRQLENLAAHERVFNHGQPLAQRDLDVMIMEKIATGQWQLVDKKNYQVGDGWYIIRTRQ